MLIGQGGFALRDYRAGDAPAVTALWRASLEHGVGIVDHHSLAEQQAALEQQVVPAQRVRVVTAAGGEIVAFVAATTESVGQLYVRVDHLRRGIGSALLRLVQDESGGSLWLYTFARNPNARRFYERHGFVEVERESENMWKLEAIKYLWTRAPPHVSDARPRTGSA